MSLYVEDHGAGEPVLLLLHGMGATGAVWNRMIASLAPRWQGRIVVVDLPGHGASDALDEYSYASVARRVAAGIPPHESLVVVGHSFGAAIAAQLASGRFDVTPAVVIGAAFKVVWTADEVAAAAAVATKPVRLFEDRGEAVDRYRRLSGLLPEITDSADDLERGVIEEDGQFRLSADPRTTGIGAPPVAASIASASCPIVLGRGELDPMVSAADLAALGVETFEIAGAGHNLHVTHPAEMARLVLEVATGR